MTIEANSSEGTPSPVAVKRDDVYKETDSITNSIKGVTGGESIEKMQSDTREVSTAFKDEDD
ncbi:immunoglobulin-like domain-containing protein, partial [Halarcobacter bivalviorum]|uniref:immunoglobulin-like domain-containing protein n=1 Tax=Halarcobacter bivalviorum TaxID=663364 RepID=UPI0039777CF1